jgi:hypothetical protein
MRNSASAKSGVGKMTLEKQGKFITFILKIQGKM